MKKSILLPFSMLLFVVLVLAACGGGNSDSASSSDESTSSNDEKEVYQINFNVSAAPTSAYTTGVAEPWAKLVEEKTDGRVEVNIFPSAALGSLETALEDVQNGVYEVGSISPGRHIDSLMYPLTITDIPFALTSPHVAAEVIEKFIGEYFGEEDSFEGLTFLSVYSSDAVNLYSKDPIEEASDLSGKIISDSVTMRHELLKELGASPAQLANTEIYEGLERGTVDGAIYTTVGADGYKLFEVAPNLTELNIGIIGQVFAINTDFFNSLPEDIQTIFKEELAPAYTKMNADLYTDLREQAIENFAAEGGNVITVTGAELDTFREPVAKLANQWVEDANSRGYDGEAMLESYKKYLSEAGVEVPF